MIKAERQGARHRGRQFSVERLKAKDIFI